MSSFPKLCTRGKLLFRKEKSLASGTGMFKPFCPTHSQTSTFLLGILKALCIFPQECNGSSQCAVRLHIDSAAAAAAAESLQSCLTLYDPIDGSLLGSPIPGILQARTLEWVAISFSNA